MSGKAETVCVSDGRGGGGCGAELKRAGSDQEHLDHEAECPRRRCSSCLTVTGLHFPGCSSPWLKAA